jgi:hypothetical protein
VWAEVEEDFYPSAVPFINTALNDNGVDDNCNGATPKCYNCTTAPLCVVLPNKVNYSVGPYNCADSDASKPYCNAGVCSDTPNLTCSEQMPKTFECTAAGVFPDPNDCQKFHVCDTNQTDTTYICSKNYVYSHAKQACARKNTTTDCAVIKCKNTTVLEYVLYPKDANVYGLCVRGKATVFRCGDREEFDTSTSICKFACKQEGLFPVDNCRKYNECVFVFNNRYNLLEWECPVGTRYNATRQACGEGPCQ